VNSLYRHFTKNVEKNPHKRILCGRPGGSWITLGDLRRRIDSFTARIEEMGVRRGDVCLVAAGNRPAFLAAVLAVWARGGVVLPIEETTPREEVGRLQRAFGSVLEIRARGGRLAATGFAGTGEAARHPGAAIIRMTSGSTGLARGALVTCSQAAADGRAIIRAMGITPDDLNLAALPLSHSYGFDNIVLPLILQGTPALILERALPSLLLCALRWRRPMILPTVPYIVDLLARHPDPPPPGSGLRLCISAGAPLPRGTEESFRRRYGVPVRTFYGASEAGGITYDGGRPGERADGCVGTPLPGVRVTIDRRGLKGLPQGDGRVVVEGPAVAHGYVPTASGDLAGGRFRTSDLGRLDREGRLHLKGRLSSLVNVSGRKVNPAEVERALRGVDGVQDVAVLGVRDRLRGERVEAWVVARPYRSPAPIRNALSSRLSPHKLPRAIHLVRAIPRTARGKIDRLRLLKRP
jgi:long-chain acyl-CoA synthetase